MSSPVRCLIAVLPLVAMAPTWGFAATLTPTTVTQFGVDDDNTSTLSPSPYGVAPASVIQQLMDNHTAFGQANGWTYRAGRALTGTFAVDEYYAWVVDSPGIASPNHPGVTYNVHGAGGISGADVGGAVFSATYTPGPGDPAVANVHFLQVISESLNGGPTTYLVDNNGGASSPFYDEVLGASTEVGGGSAWFSDEPFTCENPSSCAAEGVEDYGSSQRFGLYLAVDTPNGGSGGDTVTLYGGIQWGYDYSTVDPAPEPASWAMILGGFTALGAGLRRRRDTVA